MDGEFHQESLSILNAKILQDCKSLFYILAVEGELNWGISETLEKILNEITPHLVQGNFSIW